MAKWLKMVGLGVGMVLGIFVLWMNVTPGYYKKMDFCKTSCVRYVDETVLVKMTTCEAYLKSPCPTGIAEKVLLFLSNLDFNKKHGFN